MSVAELEYTRVEPAPESAEDLHGFLPPIGLLKDNPKDVPSSFELRDSVAKLTASFTDTIGLLLQIPTSEVTNHFVAIPGSVTIHGEHDDFRAKDEVINLGVVPLYQKEDKKPYGMMYVMERISSVNGSQAVERATISVPDNAEPLVRLERRSFHN